MAQLDSDAAETCGLYIDVENLQNDAPELVGSLINNWPSDKAPPPTKLTLYVKADMAELWNAWTINISSSRTEVEVKGIQHFTIQQSKNSADIAIALDAVTDLLHHRVNFVAVLSDDSDFISLFAKVRTETGEIQTRLGRIPFLWIMTDRDGTKTPNMQRFFPKEYVHFIPALSKHTTLPVPTKSDGPKLSANDNPVVVPTPPEELIAQAIVKSTDVGPFKSTDCIPVIKQTRPGHPLVALPSNRFGIQFTETIWPFLKAKGVERGRSKPIRYKMTQAAKDSISH